MRIHTMPFTNSIKYLVCFRTRSLNDLQIKNKICENEKKAKSYTKISCQVNCTYSFQKQIKVSTFIFN